MRSILVAAVLIGVVLVGCVTEEELGSTSQEVGAIAPTGITATAITDTRIEIGWTAVPGAFKYYVFRAQGAGPLAYVDTVLAPGTTSLSINLTPNTTYTFAVATAMPDGTESAPSTETATATTYAAGQNNVQTPSAITATVQSDTRIDLSWTAVPNAFKYYVFRAEGTGTLVYVDTVLAPGTTSYSLNLAPKTTYAFAVATAMPDGSESGPSASVSAKTLHAGQTSVAAPSNVAATTLNDTRIEVTWASVPGALKYYVQRSDGGPFVHVGSVVAPDAVFTSVYLAPNTTYRFRLVTVMPDGRESEPSAPPASAKTLAAP